MGRTPFGSLPSATRRPQGNPRVAVPIPVSRRRPCGPFSVLGLPATATKIDIVRRYRELALASHPDKCQGQAKTAATKKMQEINTAKEQCLECLETGVFPGCFERVTKTTIRVRRYRNRQTPEGKKMSSAAEWARQKEKRGLSGKKTRRQKKKSAKKSSSVRSVEPVRRGRTWDVFAAEVVGRKDRRRNGYVAVRKK